MSQTVTAVQAPVAIGRIDGHTNYASYQFIVANGVTVNVGDFVKADGSGDITSTLVTADRIMGLAESTVVGDGVKTANVCIDPMMLYLIKSDTALAATDVGKYFDLTGAAGAQTISHATGSATTGAFLCLLVGPDNRLAGYEQGVNTSSYGIFKLVESALSPLGV